MADEEDYEDEGDYEDLDYEGHDDLYRHLRDDQNDEKPSGFTVHSSFDFDPPYDKRWFVPILVCLLAIVFGGFTLAALTGPTQIGEAARPISTFGLVVSFSGFSAVTVFTVLSIKPRDWGPVSNLAIWLVVIVPAIIFPIWVLFLLLAIGPR